MLLALGAGVVVAASVLVWIDVTRLLERAFVRAARDAGFVRAEIAIRHVDFSGVDLAGLRLERPGLEVDLRRAAIGFSLRRVLGGRMGTVALEGLEVALDFTVPRRGTLPDAIEALRAHFASDDPFVWPVDTLVLEDCALALRTEGGVERFAISGSMRPARDGRIRLDLRVTHPDLAFVVEGAIDPDTLDGELTTQTRELHPDELLALAERIGTIPLPASTRLRIESAEVGGRIELRGGAPGAFGLRAEVPRSRLGREGLEAELSSLELEGGRDAAGAWSGRASGVALAMAEGPDWGLGPVSFEVALNDGQVTGELREFSFGVGPAVRGKLAVSLAAGVPALGGRDEMRVFVTASGTELAGRRLEEVRIVGSGWLDRFEITSSEIALAGATPFALSGLTVTLEEIATPTPAFRASVAVSLREGIRGLLPEGVELSEPALPWRLGRLVASGRLGPEGLRGAARLRGRPGPFRLRAGGIGFLATPSLALDAALDATGLSASAGLELERIESDHPRHPPGLDALTVSASFPRIPLDGLVALAAGEAPGESFDATLHASIGGSGPRGEGSFTLSHDGDGGAWSGAASGTIERLDGVFGPVRLEEGRVEASAGSPRIPHARFLRLLAEGGPRAWFDEIGRGLGLRVTATASGIEHGADGRASWTGFALEKTPSADGGPSIVGSLSASSGIVRVGVETVEQVTVEGAIRGEPGALEVRGAVGGLLEGAPLKLGLEQRLAVGFAPLRLRGEGRFELEPFVLADSDVVGRWIPEARGVGFGGALEARGSWRIGEDGTWDGEAEATLTDGLVVAPERRLRVEGVASRLRFTSLARLQSAPAQVFGFSRLTVGDLELVEGVARFNTRDPRELEVEDASVGLFGGRVALERVLLRFPSPDAAVVLNFDGLDAGELVRRLDLFQGSVTGRLRGRLPIGLLGGVPVLGQGFLELDPRHPADFAYDARGMFTRGLPTSSLADRINRVPYELLEEGLGGLRIEELRIDLFDRGRPETPIRIEFSGRSETDRATVPLTIVTNVNGTVAEALNLLLRLASL